MIRIAIVDDLIMLREALKRYLSCWKDIRVILEASNGRELLDKLLLCKDMPDIIMMDAHMPIMNGFLTTRYIATHYPFIKVVGMCSVPDAEVEMEMRTVGAADFIVKTADRASIVQTIGALAASAGEEEGE